jgi:hypothetical protein
MPIIDHTRFAGAAKQRKLRSYRPLFWGLAVILMVFVVANVLMAVIYNGRALPHYKLGKTDVAGKSYTTLSKQVTADTLLPAKLTLQKNATKRELGTAALGLHADTARSIQALKQARTWLPITSLFTTHTVPVSVALQSDVFKKQSAVLAPAFSKDAAQNHIIFTGSDFTIEAPQTGYRMDSAALKQALQTVVADGKSMLTVPTIVTVAPPATDLSSELDKLKKQLSLTIQFSVGGKNTQVSRADIGKWFTADGQTMAPAYAAVTDYVNRLSPNASNASDLVHAVRYVLRKNQNATFTVVGKGAPVRTYCTASRGVTGADLDDLAGKLAATYADPRGWNDDGKLAFQYATAGCEYTVWLAAPSQMTSFGDICDDYYNCQVGTNVIVNDDRWNKATDPWNATGASIEDYRTLIINHETGHRLGFLDNNVCPSPGGPAPVMLQQSIDLMGCTFNRWPTTAELDALTARNGL